MRHVTNAFDWQWTTGQICWADEGGVWPLPYPGLCLDFLLLTFDTRRSTPLRGFCVSTPVVWLHRTMPDSRSLPLPLTHTHTLTHSHTHTLPLCLARCSRGIGNLTTPEAVLAVVQHNRRCVRWMARDMRYNGPRYDDMIFLAGKARFFTDGYSSASANGTFN